MSTQAPASLEQTPAERLAQKIREEHARDLVSQIRTPSTQPYFYLSGIHTCARNLFYQVTAGDKRPPFDPYVQAILESGVLQESWVKRKLLDWGLEMLRAGEEVLIPYGGRLKEHHGELMGKGKVDGIFLFRDDHTGPKGIEIPGEIKSMDGNKFKALNTVDDLLNKDEFTERYVKQLLTYMLGKNRENGVFVLTDCRGHIKPIPVFLHNHLEVAELALKTMEKGWEAKILGEAPDRIAFHSRICGRCNFAPICLPEQVLAGADVIDDPELEAALARELELKPLAAEYDELHENTKELFANRPRTTVSGRFEVTSATQRRKKVDTKLLDAETLAKITVPNDVHIVKVKDLLTKA
jgi:hypothetical protein